MIALPVAAVISGVTMEVAFGIMNREWFDPRQFDFTLLKELLAIAIPLLPNFLIYWVFNSCDKVMVTNMIGIGAAGIYSVGSKLGHTFNKVSEPILSLKKTVDVIIAGDAVYMLSMAGENLFGMERAYKAVCKNKVNDIIACDFLTNAE